MKRKVLCLTVALLVILATASVFAASYEKTTYTIGYVHIPRSETYTANDYRKTDTANTAVISCRDSAITAIRVWIGSYGRERISNKKTIGEGISTTLSYYAGTDKYKKLYRTGFESYNHETGNAYLRFAP